MARPKGPKKPLKGLQIVENEGVKWINLSKPTPTSLKTLREFHPSILDIDIQDCLPPFQRPKLLEREDYLFMVLLYPIYDPVQKMVRPVEVDFFVGKDFIITSHAEELQPLIELARSCSLDERACNLRLGDSPAQMLYNILHELLISVFPILTRLANDIMLAEKDVFREYDHETIRQILRIKSNIVQCRQTMQGHKMVIRKFVSRAKRVTELDGLGLYFEDLVGHTKEIWDYLENDKDTIDAIYESHTSLITHNTSLASQRLAALALIIFPTTLVAALFAMDAVNMPIKGSPYDFWVMFGFVMLTMAGTVGFLKWKKWL